MPKVMMLGDVGLGAATPAILTPAPTSTVPTWVWWTGGIVAAVGVTYVGWRLLRRRR
jgi:hypothetical protein